MQVEQTGLDGVVILTPRRFEDARGHFCETWNARTMAAAGLDLAFVQDNHSLSRRAGTVRGLHFQRPPEAQAKLVRCTRGRLFDVAVDLRRGSPTYARWVGVELTPENARQLLIPVGFAHGFVTRAPDTEVQYKCTAFYAPECDAALRFDDPDIGIDWGIDPAAAILSDKDAAAPYLAAIESPFVFDEGRR